jgi:hypothetical protein
MRFKKRIHKESSIIISKRDFHLRKTQKLTSNFDFLSVAQKKLLRKLTTQSL